jgi:hypothetical protein
VNQTHTSYLWEANISFVRVHVSRIPVRLQLRPASGKRLAADRFYVDTYFPRALTMSASIEKLLQSLLENIYLCQEEVAHHFKMFVTRNAAAPRVVA